MKVRKNLVALLLLTAVSVQAVAAQAIRITPAERKVAEGVTARQLSDYLHFVASDEMEGRDTPSRGLDLTAKFIAMNLSRWGVKPAGDNGSYFQKFALRSETTDPTKNTLTVGERSFTFLEDFFRVGGNSAAAAPMVFASHGWMVRSKNVDAYAGVDVRDKIVVVYGPGFPRPDRLTGFPQGVTDADLSGAKGTDWADPATYARSRGAKGLIVVASPQIDGAWGQIRGLFSRGTMYPEKLLPASAATPASDLPVMLVSGRVADSIFEGESGDRNSTQAFVLNRSAQMQTGARVETKWTQNVVALWEGSDPVLKNEMVAIGAHYDHVGINPNAPGDDKIYNGADDDGSGTVAVMAIAEAFATAKVRPKRSILYVWHAGEEKGLWGSEIFNKFPTVDITKVVAQLNLDMIGRSKLAGDTNPKNANLTGPNEIYVIGSEMMSSTLGAVVKGTNSAYLDLAYNYRYDDPADTERFFFRSDHFHYAVNGIPIAFWFDGVHEDYHGPGDHPDKIDYAKMERVTRTIMLTPWKIADLRQRPAVDKELPPELRQR